MKPFMIAAALAGCLLAAAPANATPALMGAATPVAGVATPPEFTFADCPAKLPDGVDPSRWKCEEMHATGHLRIGGQTLPVRIVTTHAEGPSAGGGPSQFVFGALRSDPVPIPLVPEVPTLGATGKLRYAGFIDFPDGPTMVEVLHLSMDVSHPLLGRRCAIGNATDPIRVVGEVVGDREVISTTPLVLKFRVEDKALAVPRTYGCGPLGRVLDQRLGLPQPAGANELALTVYFSARSWSPR